MCLFLEKHTNNVHPPEFNCAHKLILTKTLTSVKFSTITEIPFCIPFNAKQNGTWILKFEQYNWIRHYADGTLWKVTPQIIVIVYFNSEYESNGGREMFPFNGREQNIMTKLLWKNRHEKVTCDPRILCTLVFESLALGICRLNLLWITYTMWKLTIFSRFFVMSYEFILRYVHVFGLWFIVCHLFFFS